MEDRRGLLPLPGLGQLAGLARQWPLPSGTTTPLCRQLFHGDCARSLCCIWCYGRAADASGLIPVTTAVVIKCERLLVLVEFSQVLKAVSCIRIIPKMPYMQLCCHCWVLKPFCLNTESYSCTILTKRNFFQLEKICFYSIIFSLLKKMLVAWRCNFESSLLPVLRGWEGLLWFLLLVKGANAAPKFVISQSIGKVMFTFSDAKGPYIFGFPFSLSFPDFGCLFLGFKCRACWMIRSSCANNSSHAREGLQTDCLSFAVLSWPRNRSHTWFLLALVLHSVAMRFGLFFSY